MTVEQKIQALGYYAVSLIEASIANPDKLPPLVVANMLYVEYDRLDLVAETPQNVQQRMLKS